MILLKKILFSFLVVFIAIQFIRPSINSSGYEMPADITKQFSMPPDVQNILKTSCYDCHSNNTNYPWYANIQPMGWLLAKHIKDGKADLNFNEFGSYVKRRQVTKLKGIANSIKDGSMPLASYTWMHNDAKLGLDKKQRVSDWLIKTRDSIEAKQ